MALWQFIPMSQRHDDFLNQCDCRENRFWLHVAAWQFIPVSMEVFDYSAIFVQGVSFAMTGLFRSKSLASLSEDWLGLGVAAKETNYQSLQITDILLEKVCVTYVILTALIQKAYEMQNIICYT